MLTVLTAIVWINLFLAAYFVVKESIYFQKRKKIVTGARFNNKWQQDPIEWITVVECDYQNLCV
jgi:hypothetical protein